MSRKVAFDADDEPKGKRPRLANNAGISSSQNETPPSLDSVNDDCLLLILSYLPAEDLNSIDICSKRYRKARAHESLDQTRTGTIVISKGTSLRDLLNAIIENRWNQVFRGNRTHLVITGLEKLRDEPHAQVSHPRIQDARLPAVTRVDLQCSPPPPGRQYVECLNHTSLICSLFQNIRELRLRNFTASNPAWLLGAYFLGRPKNQLARISWTGCENQCQPVDGVTFMGARNLTELSLDDCRFDKRGFQTEWQSFSNTANDDMYMFSRCRRLERLSIKNAKYKYNEASESFKQDVLMKMVRNHPTLRWLRSDLSPENIAILQQERPDVTFVSE